LRYFNYLPTVPRHLDSLLIYSAHPVWCLSIFWVGVTLPTLQADLVDLRVLAVITTVSVILTMWKRAFIGVVFVLFGFCWATYSFEQHREHRIPKDYERKSIAIQGEIIDLPSQIAGNYRFRFRVSQVPNPELKMLIGEKIQLSCYRCPLSLQANEKWLLTVRLKRPHGYASWGSFDYEKYLFRHRILGRGYVRVKENNRKISETGMSINQWRMKIRVRLQELVQDQGVGGAMIAALTIGDKSGFTQSQRRVFQESGVSHLMAISGLHIGLVFACVCLLVKCLLWPFAQVFERVPRLWLCYAPALFAASAYAAMAGFAVSTQRALLMLLVYVVCRLWARSLNLFHILLVAVFILLIYDPFSVLDTGFWLSCGAVAIIAYASKQAQRLSLLRLQPTLWLGMLPMSSVFFGQISLVSPLVNLVFVPLFCLFLIPLTLLSLVLMLVELQTVAQWLFSFLSSVFSQAYQVLEWITEHRLARWYTTPFAGWQWGLIGLALIAAVAGLRSRYVLWLALLASVFIGAPRNVGEDTLRIVLLDVGQGLSMVIESANEVVVYDTGPRYSSGFTVAEAVLLPYLRQRGIRKIDKLIISHADNDHIGGYATVTDAFSVDKTLSSRPDKLVDATHCRAGQGWRDESTHFKILSPEKSTPNGSNNRSCVISIEHFGKRVLISGDIEKQVERFLVAQTVNSPDFLNADIMLVPHQGSKTSSTPEFIDAVQPELALVAAGYQNHYGHPHQKVMQRYRHRRIDSMSTIDEGSILVVLDRNGWRASSYRRSKQRFWHY